MKWLELDRSARIVLERDEAQKVMFMGNAPILDPALVYVLKLYWELRRGTPGDQPLNVGWEVQERTNPLLLHLLFTADSEFMSQQAAQHERRMAQMKSEPVGSKPKGRLH
jgi:hypothetical protein